MDRIYRLLKMIAGGAQTALAQCAQWIREKALTPGHNVAAAPWGLRPVPVRARATRPLRGFTLIELMVSLVVAAILLGVGVPSFQQFIKANRIKSEFGDLTEALNIARSEAAKKAAVVRVCARAGDLCSVNASDWSKGWIVFYDKDGDGVPDADEVLHDHTQPYGAVVVQHTAVAVDFQPAGDVGALKTFHVCDDRAGAYARKVEVANSGRVSVDPSAVSVTAANASAKKCI